MNWSTGVLLVPGFTTLVDNVSSNKPSTSMTHVAWETATFRSSMHPCVGKCVVIGHASCIMPRLPTHSVQELNVGTVLVVKCTGPGLHSLEGYVIVKLIDVVLEHGRN